MEKIALILIYLTWFLCSLLCSISFVYFCNVHVPIMNLAYFNPHYPAMGYFPYNTQIFFQSYFCLQIGTLGIKGNAYFY